MPAKLGAGMSLKGAKWRPQTTFRPEYVDQLIEFFSKDVFTVMTVRTEHADGRVEEKPLTNKFGEIVMKASKWPTQAGFCAKVKCTPKTFQNWVKAHPLFREAWEVCKAIQEEHLITNTLLGNYDSRFAALAAKNVIGWRDRSEVSGDAEKPIYARVVMVPPKNSADVGKAVADAAKKVLK